jgi:beta-phosphoglucomutase family hydrolase
MTQTGVFAHSRAVLWDLDGTLIDSGLHHYQAWTEILADEGVAFSLNQFVSTFGQRNDLVLRQFISPDITRDEIDRIAATKERRYRELVRAQGVQFLPGGADWLAALRCGGWKQALVTSAPCANVEVVVAALGAAPYFDAIVAAEDVTHGKPDPEVFLLAAQRIGASAAQCIVVEDAPAGIEGARRAGMHTVGIGNHAKPARPDLHFGALTDLPPDLFERVLAV